LLSTAWLTLQPAAAEEVALPIAMQLELLDRVLRFERNYSAHVGQPALVVLAYIADDAASERGAAQAGATLEQAETLGGRRANVLWHPFSSAATLATAAHAQNAAIVFVMPGFQREDVTAIADAFSGSRMLTVSASAPGVDNGLALGFELVSSKPRILVNLPRARAQHLDFNAQLLRLARVIQ
jgi:hypothetical protein